MKIRLRKKQSLNNAIKAINENKANAILPEEKNPDAIEAVKSAPEKVSLTVNLETEAVINANTKEVVSEAVKEEKKEEVKTDLIEKMDDKNLEKTSEATLE